MPKYKMYLAVISDAEDHASKQHALDSFSDWAEGICDTIQNLTIEICEAHEVEDNN